MIHVPLFDLCVVVVATYSLPIGDGTLCALGIGGRTACCGVLLPSYASEVRHDVLSTGRTDLRAGGSRDIAWYL